MNNVSVESFINFCDDMIIAEEGILDKFKKKKKDDKPVAVDNKIDNAMELEEFKKNIQEYKLEYNKLVKEFMNAAKKVTIENDKYVKPYGKFRTKLTNDGVSVYVLDTYTMCDNEYSDEYLDDDNFPFSSIRSLQNCASSYIQKLSSCVKSSEHFTIIDDFDEYGESDIIIKFKRGVKANNKLINPMKFIC